MAGQPEESPKGDVAWHQEVEGLLKSLTGVISARVVSRPGGGVEEVHLLTTLEVTPKQAVRNVESALLAHFDLPVDHRKVSVAQTTSRPEDRTEVEVAPATLDPTATTPPPARLSEAARSPRPIDPFDDPVPPVPDPKVVAPEVRAPKPTTAPPVIERVEPQQLPEGRILFVGHSIESLRSQRVNMKVALEWKGTRLVGEASGADLARSRLEGFASATLDAVEHAFDPDATSEHDHLALTLDGVQTVEAFDRQFVLVSVSALIGKKVTHLTGAAAVEDSRDRAVILATLQATDRRVRAFLEGVAAEKPEVESTAADGDPPVSENPFEVWA